MALLPTRILSTFSGIGGLDLGLRLLLPAARVVCYVEGEAFAAATLVKAMQDGWLDQAPIWSDIRTFRGAAWRGRVDLVAGGFPCQDISGAGKGAGIINGKRSSLWFDLARVIRDVGPQYVFVENVRALSRRGLDAVLGTLASLGYDAVWDLFSAAETSAPHRRERLFILAYRQRTEWGEANESGVCPNEGLNSRRQASSRSGISSSKLAYARRRDSTGRGGSGDVAGSTGNSEGPSPEQRERLRNTTGYVSDPMAHPTSGSRQNGQATRGLPGRLAGASVDVGHTHDAGLQGRGLSNSGCGDQRTTWPPSSPFPPRPDDLHAWRGVSPDLEPAICGVATGIPDRVDRLRALGNAVVPIVAAVAFATLWERMNS